MNQDPHAHLFFDDSLIDSLEGVARGVEPVPRHSSEPLIQRDQPWEEPWHIGAYINVIHDHDDGLFKMWYGVGRKLSDVRGESADGLAYAVSQDGIHWEKPVLNLVDDGAGKQNNLVFPMLRWAAGTGVMKDPTEQDPERLYKMLFMFQSSEMAFAGIVQPICIACSADGIHWNVPGSWVNPVIPEGTDTHLTAYWDPKIRRYVVYLRGRPNVRIICMAESHDFESWTPRVTIVEPDEHDPPQDHEFYGMSSMAYRGFRIGFLSIFHTLEEGWIAANQIEDWMPPWMNQMDIQLTYSADGRDWQRAGNREPILTCGPDGSFDSGCVYPCHAPIVVGDETWLYYGGSNKLHGEPPRDGAPIRRAIGLAKIRKDRFVCLRARGEGVATTATLGVRLDKLRINADATGGSLAVEVLDPFNRVIPGFSRDDCVPFDGDDTDHRVQWRNDPSVAGAPGKGGLEEKMVSQSHGAYKIRMIMNRAKLFAIYSEA